jgi:4-hydroxymandelate oxidase
VTAPHRSDSAAPATPLAPRNVAQYETAARALLSPAIYDYYAGGAEDELTLRWNEAAFRQFALRPRVLVDVSRIDPSVELLGDRLAFPVLLAPTAFQRLAHPDGELATARAAAAAGTVFVSSTLSTFTIEEIAAASQRLWLQLYVFRDRGITRSLVERAEATGCRAISLTVTVPVQGNRERDAYNRFALPPGIEIANFTGLRQSRFPDADASRLNAFIDQEFDPSLSWRDIEWLRSITKLPIVLKGIMAAEDGVLAVEHGVAAVVVSNHGGRQLDTVVATAHALTDVVDGVDGRCEVYVDGGIRTGADVLKALALGARAVLVGRSVVWGLAIDGEAGARAVLDELAADLARAMAFCGVTSPSAIPRDLVAP